MPAVFLRDVASLRVRRMVVVATLHSLLAVCGKRVTAGKRFDERHEVVVNDVDLDGRLELQFGDIGTECEDGLFEGIDVGTRLHQVHDVVEVAQS